ncbi:39S ribosomal protein L13, mitochondrial [Frankliniella fusca]|uniref:39S ribosomal protein L13, mitochondrial n=1 Tax=Frankliniella fusca TaxID=407009 RepID=A0AAE1GTU3_9NEOP|nr:39S ribosomal protein L13, mitochondrial [Frankliniella fusca]
MSSFKRGQQWATFARIWHLYDMKWQNPYESAYVIKKYLSGLWKPIYHPLNNCGDHVVVINSREVALPGDDWYRRAYFHHRTYAGSKTWTLAWELHQADDTLIVKKAVYTALDKGLLRRPQMERLHIFPDDKIPPEIAANITNQIRQLRPVPKKLEEIPEEVAKQCPQLFDFPKDFVEGSNLWGKPDPEMKAQPIRYPYKPRGKEPW